LVFGGVPIGFIDDGAVRRVAQKIHFAFILIILAAFAGARSPYVDRDFGNYAIWFNAIAEGNATFLGWLRDPAFAFLSYLVSLCRLSFSALAFMYAFLGLGAALCFGLLTTVHRWATLFFYLFFCQYFMVFEMTEIRSAVAVPLMAVSIYLACERQRRKAVFLFIVALLFHFSAIMGLPILILLLTEIQFRSRWWLYSVALFGVIVSAGMNRLVVLLSGLYRISEFVNGGAEENDLRVISWYALAHFLTIVVGLVLWKKLSLHQKVAVLLSGFGLCLFLVFGANTGLATRFLYLFDVYWILMLVMFLERLKGDKRLLYIAFLSALGLGLYIKSLQYVEPYSISITMNVLQDQPILSSISTW
jgi:hypothetical protein